MNGRFSLGDRPVFRQIHQLSRMVYKSKVSLYYQGFQEVCHIREVFVEDLIKELGMDLVAEGAQCWLLKE